MPAASIEIMHGGERAASVPGTGGCYGAVYDAVSTLRDASVTRTSR